MPLKWTSGDTQYESNDKDGNRWTLQCPMFHDGENLHVLVPYMEKNHDDRVVRYVLETYMIVSDTELHLVREVTLKSEDEDTHWKSEYNHQFFDSARIVVNESDLLIHFKEMTDIFSLATGLHRKQI